MPTQCSPFWNFAQEQKRLNPGWQNLSNPELLQQVGPMWDQLNKTSKSRYKDETGRQMLDGSKDSMGRDLQAVALRIQEKENDPLVMRSKIRNLLANGDYETAVITVIHINIFEKIDGIILPAEICVANFSLEKGLFQLYHEFPAPGKVPMGWKATCIQGSERSHKIPLDLCTSNPNYHDILASIEDLLDAQTGDKLMFTWGSKREIVQETLDFLYTKALKSMNAMEETEKATFPCSVLDINELYRYICKAIPQQASGLVPNLDNCLSMWDGIACDLHLNDGMDVTYCSQALVRNWIYNFCRTLCPVLDIPLIPGKHKTFPVRALEFNETGEPGSNDVSSIEDSCSDTGSVISVSSEYGGGGYSDYSDVESIRSRDSSSSLRRQVEERLSMIRLQQQLQNNNQASRTGGRLPLTSENIDGGRGVMQSKLEGLCSSTESLNTNCSEPLSTTSSGCSRMEVMQRIRQRVQGKEN